MNVDDEVAKYHFEYQFKGINIDVEEDTNQKELIEQDLDSQPVDPQEDEFIWNVPIPEILPSYKNIVGWILENYTIIDKDSNQITNEEILEGWYAEYKRKHRKALKEWWFNRQKSKLNEQSSNPI